MRGLSARRIPAGQPCEGALVVRLHVTADPTMTPERLEAIQRSYTRLADYQQEIDIIYEAFEGNLVWPEYKPDINDCEPFDVSDPDVWSIWMACDPHMRTPHAFAWEALNKEGESVVCGELWPGQQYTVHEYADTIHWIESDSTVKPPAFAWANGKRLRIIKRFMDTHGTAANSDEGIDFFKAYRGHGLNFYAAAKSAQALAAARDRVGRLMVPTECYVGDEIIKFPRRRVFRTCVELRNEYMNMRYPSGEVERAGQEKPKTYRKHVSDCVAEGSLVLTRRGQVPIESVKTTDEVWTRKGWKRVLAAWCVGDRDVLRITTSSGSSLVATPEHRIWVNGGWRELRDVLEADIVLACQTPLSFREESIVGEAIISTLQSALHYTEPFGKRIEGQFLKAISSITRTAIPPTIAYRIWKASQCGSILESIGLNIQKLKNVVRAAAKNLMFLSTFNIAQVYALKIAGLPFGTGLELITKQESAPYVAKSLSVTDTQRKIGRAPVFAAKPNGKARVFDLTVEDAHEFFVNGILVHNCCMYIHTANPSYVKPVPNLIDELVFINEAVGY